MARAPLYKHAALGGQAARQAVPLIPLHCLPCSSTGMESPMGHSSSWHCPAIKPLAMALHSSKLPLPTTVPAGASRLYPTGRQGSRAPSPEHPKAKGFGSSISCMQHLASSLWPVRKWKEKGTPFGVNLMRSRVVHWTDQVCGMSHWSFIHVNCSAWNDAKGLHDRQHCTSEYA